MEYIDKKFEFLSGGNKRKCCFAVAIIAKPKSCFLDECSTGLDPMSRKAMMKVL
jgi:ABC-type multidrug transport system ATPase subunit